MNINFFKYLNIFFTVIADVGGLLGLFLGCSLLSLVEIFYFIFSALTKTIKRNHTITESMRKVTFDPDILKLKEDLKNLSTQFEMFSNQHENTAKNELLKRVARLEQYVKEISQKISNLEKHALIVTDY